MLSDLQRISKGLIIYSSLISDFEKLDFKNDALAGVRANYFNSNHSPQTDKTEFLSENRNYSISYTMRKGEPLLWKVAANNIQYQKVKRVSEEVYCVLSYNDNGIVNKRMYFDNFHNWLATEYYDNELENSLLAVTKPVTLDGVCCIKLSRTGKSDAYLYPSQSSENKKCECLIYTNCGMLWYDASFKPADIPGISAESKAEKGFNFTVDDFIKPAVKPLDLFNAEYLSEADFAGESSKQTAEPEPDKTTYSAYDKIRSILYEAHKTNKNIFGEVASYSDEILTEDSQDIPGEEEKPEANETLEAVPETGGVSKDTLADSEDNSEDTPKKSENTSEKEESFEVVSVEKPEFKVKEQCAPDSKTETQNGVYSYFGKLDDYGKRTGLGRTVSPDGLTVYEGSYSDDKREGFGVSYYKDGKPNYTGNWVNGNRSGSGVGYRRTDGTMHVGRWVDNTPDGVGARFSADGGFIDVCGYSMGTREGKSISFDEYGNIVITVYISGEVVAERIISDEDIFPKQNNAE